MNKVLVAYATRTGCTAGAADKIGDTLEAEGLDVDVLSVGFKPDPAEYDAILLGSGVRAGNWHGPAKSWLKHNAEELKSKPLALFTCCLTMASEPQKADEVRAYTAPLLADTGLKPLDIGLFAGWFEPDKFSLVGRTILKKMGAPEGDHRDWDAIALWSKEMVPKLDKPT